MATRSLDISEEEAATAVALIAAIAAPPEEYMDLRISALVRKAKAAFANPDDEVVISVIRKPGDGLIRDHTG